MSDEKTKADVRAAVLEGFRTWCAKDIEAWKRAIHPAIYGYNYTGDLLFESAPGEMIYDAFRSVCDSGLASSMSPSHVATRLAGKDAAIATMYIQGKETWPGAYTIEGAWRATVVLTRVDGAWKWLHFHYSPLTTSQSVRKGS